MRKIKKDACEGFRGGKVPEVFGFRDTLRFKESKDSECVTVFFYDKEDGLLCREEISKSLLAYIRDLEVDLEICKGFAKELGYYARLEQYLGEKQNERD